MYILTNARDVREIEIQHCNSDRMSRGRVALASKGHNKSGQLVWGPASLQSDDIGISYQNFHHAPDPPCSAAAPLVPAPRAECSACNLSTSASSSAIRASALSLACSCSSDECSSCRPCVPPIALVHTNSEKAEKEQSHQIYRGTNEEDGYHGGHDIAVVRRVRVWGRRATGRGRRGCGGRRMSDWSRAGYQPL